MTEQEAFEKWWRDTDTIGMVTTAEAGWRAALEWARNQQEPVAYVGKCASLGHKCLSFEDSGGMVDVVPLYPAPVIAVRVSRTYL